MAFGESLKARSYDVRVGRGDEVELLEPVGEHPRGTRCVVISESNAGFRGIEAHITVLEDGHKYHHVSTGLLRLLSSKEAEWATGEPYTSSGAARPTRWRRSRATIGEWVSA